MSSTLQRDSNKDKKREYTERIFCPVCSTPNRAFMDSEIIKHFPNYQHNIKRPLLEATIRQAHFVENRPYGRNSFCPYCNIHFRVNMTTMNTTTTAEAEDSITRYLQASRRQNNNNDADLIRQLIYEKYIEDTSEHGRNYPYDSISRGPANPIAVRNASLAKTKTGELHFFCPACSDGNTTVSLRTGSLVAMASNSSGKEEHEILDITCEQCGAFELRRTDTLTGSWRDVEFSPKESHPYF